MTIEEVVKDWEANPEVMEEIYKVMITNNSIMLPLFGNKFQILDPIVEMNNCTYWFNNKELFGFKYDVGKVFKINISVPEDWKDRVVKYYFNKRN